MERVFITGSREWRDDTTIRWALVEHVPLGAILVHGTARGADTVAAEFWAPFGSVEPHPADWDRYGRRAGHVRNAEMVAAGADLCLAFIRDRSPGATGCAALAEAAGIHVITYTEGAA